MLRQMILGGALGAAVLAGAPAAWADHGYHGGRHVAQGRPYGERYDYADVVRVEPLVRHVRVRTPVEECWDEVEYYAPDYRPYHANTTGSTILGGIIGGVIGHQFGSGSGKDAATVAGVVIGSAVGHDVAKRRQQNAAGYYEPTRSHTVERCKVDYQYHEEERVDGYLVTYEYHGREYQVRTPRPPGDKIRVRVSVTPAPY